MFGDGEGLPDSWGPPAIGSAAEDLALLPDPVLSPPSARRVARFVQLQALEYGTLYGAMFGSLCGIFQAHVVFFIVGLPIGAVVGAVSGLGLGFVDGIVGGAYALKACRRGLHWNKFSRTICYIVPWLTVASTLFAVLLVQIHASSSGEAFGWLTIFYAAVAGGASWWASKIMLSKLADILRPKAGVVAPIDGHA